MAGLKGKRISVLGAAKSGIDAANLCVKYGAKVLLSDNKPEQELRQVIGKVNPEVYLEFGGHSNKLFECDIMIVSPGVPACSEVVVNAGKHGVEVMAELEFAWRLISPAYAVAITGTNGKTTTTTLIDRIFRDAINPGQSKNMGYDNVLCAGNIGTPLSGIVEQVTESTVLIIEVSSYQLELCSTFCPKVGVLMNLTPDHLKRHGTMDRYAEIKQKVFDNHKSNGKHFAVLNYDDQYCRRVADKIDSEVLFFSCETPQKQGLWYSDSKAVGIFRDKQYEFNLSPVIPGMHNVSNILAATSVGLALGFDEKVVSKTVNTFEGVEHRIEFVRELHGVKYYNDSKATNVDSVVVALESFKKNVVLIMGGQDKGSPYKPLMGLIKNRVKSVLLIGEAARIISGELGHIVPTVMCKTLTGAVEYAHVNALPGDVVLLSPACASFDQFSDYEHRGKVFKELVNRL
ncbi:MAG: UDP-N-acetylmuramoyl-L-alanine--D-glutamate ligase [Elusimicrobiota bacterium]